MNKESIWTRDLTPWYWPFFWKYLAIPMAILLTYLGARAIALREIHYKGQMWHGPAAVFAGIGMLLFSISIVIRATGNMANVMHSRSRGAFLLGAIGCFLLFVVFMWIEALRH